MQYKSKFAKNKKDGSVNKFTTSMLIAQNGKVHMPTNMTNMTIFMSSDLQR